MKQSLKIEFKTGELVVTDWISLKEFDEQVGSIRLLRAPRGTTLSTEEAANHNFVRIHVGDIDPNIHRKDNDFSFGLTKEKKDYENIGSVNVGVWAVTMIERQNLIDIVANKVGQKQAELLVQNYLSTKNHTIANIEPGVYTLKFDPEATYAKEIFSLKKDKVAKSKKMKM